MRFNNWWSGGQRSKRDTECSRFCLAMICTESATSTLFQVKTDLAPDHANRFDGSRTTLSTGIAEHSLFIQAFIRSKLGFGNRGNGSIRSKTERSTLTSLNTRHVRTPATRIFLWKQIWCAFSNSCDSSQASNHIVWAGFDTFIASHTSRQELDFIWHCPWRTNVAPRFTFFFLRVLLLIHQ